MIPEDLVQPENVFTTPDDNENQINEVSKGGENEDETGKIKVELDITENNELTEVEHQHFCNQCKKSFLDVSSLNMRKLFHESSTYVTNSQQHFPRYAI